MLTGLPLGANPLDTGEFLLGRVAVTPIFFESTGAASTQDWTQFEIDGVLQKIRDGMQWWVDTLANLDSVHTLEFVYDETYALNPVETGFEPIDRTSDTNRRYVGQFLEAQGIPSSLTFEDAIRSFNHQQRVALDADWGITIVVVDSSEGEGTFAAGGSFATAFAYPGGQYMVVPSTRPTSTFTHELSHLFWGDDEYVGGDPWTDRRGYYNTQNLNAAENPTPGFQQEISIMAGGTFRTAAFQQNVSPASTLAFLGWQDSDGDGIFDVLDVPLELNGVGRFDAEASRLRFEGTARAVALPNQNSLGRQNDITLNRISRIEYRVDGGNWLTAVSPDLQETEVSFEVPLQPGFETVEIRAIDAATGVTSPSITVSELRPGAAPSSIQGFAFLDADGGQTLSAGEAPVSELVATVIAADSGALPAHDVVDPAQLDVGDELDALEGLDFVAVSPRSAGQVSIQEGAGGQRLFAWHQVTTGTWQDHWSPYEVLDVAFDDLTSEVGVTITGTAADSVGRLEAFDSDGNLLARATSPKLAEQESAFLRVADPDQRIAIIRISGHERSEIQIERFVYGPQRITQTDSFGVMRFENLPDDVYEIAFQPQLVIHDVADTIRVEVVDGRASPLEVAVQRVASPWRNPEMSGDVDNSGDLDAVDALAVIHYLNRFGIGALPAAENIGTFVDADGDGFVSPADALWVINALNRQARQQAQGEASSGWFAATSTGSQDGDEDRLQDGDQRGGDSLSGTHVDRWMESEFFREEPADEPLSGMGKGSKGSDYADFDTLAGVKPEDPLNPFFSEPLGPEGI